MTGVRVAAHTLIFSAHVDTSAPLAFPGNGRAGELHVSSTFPQRHLLWVVPFVFLIVLPAWFRAGVRGIVPVVVGLLYVS